MFCFVQFIKKNPYLHWSYVHCPFKLFWFLFNFKVNLEDGEIFIIFFFYILAIFLTEDGMILHTI